MYVDEGGEESLMKTVPEITGGTVVSVTSENTGVD